MTLRAEEIFAVLHRHEVRYVVIGGLGAVLHGSPIVTQDADICPARDRANLDRLAAALRDLKARLRVANAPDGIAFPFEGAFLANVQLLNLTTPFGDLDLSYEPAGTRGYADLEPNATLYEIGGKQVAVAALDADAPRESSAKGALVTHGDVTVAYASNSTASVRMILLRRHDPDTAYRIRRPFDA